MVCSSFSMLLDAFRPRRIASPVGQPCTALIYADLVKSQSGICRLRQRLLRMVKAAGPKPKKLHAVGISSTPCAALAEYVRGVRSAVGSFVAYAGGGESFRLHAYRAHPTAQTSSQTASFWLTRTGRQFSSDRMWAAPAVSAPPACA